MGADQLFKKARERHEKSFQRIAAWRKQNKVVLIVCQGEKTEPHYLKGLQSVLSLANASLIMLDRAQGRDALSVVKAGIAEYQKDPSAYDKVFCVFDKDGDARYSQAVNLARTHPLGVNQVLYARTSVPCFEIWLLLHFVYSTAAYVSGGGKSACDKIIAELRKVGRIPGYAKAHKGIYELLSSRMSTAKKHAKQLRKDNSQIQSDNPSTSIDLLVDYLETIAPK